MENYTIYCTEEPTKKALELGAPIELKKHTYFDYKGSPNSYYDGEICPTAEQMISWLEEQEPIKEITIYRYQRLVRRYWCYDIFDEKGYGLLVDEEYFPNHGESYSSRKEATIAAIDAALEYLNKNGK